MADLLSQLSRERADLTHSVLAPLAAGELEDRLRAGYQTQAEEFGLDANSIDPKAAEAYMLAELERDLIVGFRGYSDWLATFLWRRKLRGGSLPAVELEMPILDDGQRRDIALRFDVNEEILRWLEDALKRASTAMPLPGIGAIARGRLRIDIAALSRWASCFEWTAGDEH